MEFALRAFWASEISYIHWESAYWLQKYIQPVLSPGAPLNNMHPNLAWTLVAGWRLGGWGVYSQITADTPIHTHTGKQARTPG